MTSKHWSVLGALGAVVLGCSLEEPTPDASGGASGTSGSTGGTSRGGSAGVNGGSAGKGGSAGAVTTGGSAGSGGSAATTGGTSGQGGSNAAGSSGRSGAGNAGGTPTTGGAAGMSGGTSNSGAGGRAGGGGAAGGGMGGAAGAMGGAGGATGGTAGAGGGLPLGNPPVLSAGCGKATSVTSGKKNITSSGQQRSYIIDIPANYDMNKPYRLFYTSHWIGSTSEAVRDQNYYFLKPLANAAMEPAIFVAPQSDGATWQQKDHALFDDLLAYVKENLCIDTTRVFATGFSFGGMITYSLSLNHQKDIRAGVGIAPANYNIWMPPKSGEPIAWMQTTGMGDSTCPWVNGNSSTQGAKFIAIEHATNNGCTVPANLPIWQQGGYVCYDFEGCDAGYPTKACTFNGGHTNIDNDSSGNNWIAKESWEFFRQF
jgi:poly(3-hydroxybutyrate) depolymerase